MTENYIGPERQLTGGPALPTETLVNQLVDRAYLIAEEFSHTRSKSNLIQLVQVIVNLNKLGYDFIWDRRRHIVGVTAKAKPRTNVRIVNVTQKGLTNGTTQIN